MRSRTKLYLVIQLATTALLASGLQNNTLTYDTSHLIATKQADNEPPVDSSRTTTTTTTLTPSRTSDEPTESSRHQGSHYRGANEDELQAGASNGEAGGQPAEGSDLSQFRLMNAAHERVQAVQHLLSTQSSMLQLGSGQQNQNPIPSNTMPFCTHKGRQYSHGQTVAIEEQPCLNCTCNRAILQCYLRVCPPFVSLEAQRRAQAAAAAVTNSGTSEQRCRLVKEANQCCPSLRCESAAANDSQSGDKTRPFLSDTNTVVPASSAVAGVALRTQPEEAVARQQTDEFNLVNHSSPIHNRSVDAEQVSDTHAATTTLLNKHDSTAPDDQQQEGSNTSPKMAPVGSSGQRDSILLITSNPTHASGDAHRSSRPGNGGGSVATNNGSATDVSNNLAPGGSEYAHALMEALLETVYSSAAQLNGMNLQGSCMVNGSLYVEGSAVIPEGNNLCQYCYCIRQKIMCVKPKCHLMISGCTPKYSNEYACCPTSYACSNSLQESLAPPTSPVALMAATRAHPPRLAAENQSLSAKLLAAIESISRMTSQASAAPEKPGLSLLNSFNSLPNDTLATTTQPLSLRTREPATTSSPPASSTTSFPTTTTIASSTERRPELHALGDNEQAAALGEGEARANESPGVTYEEQSTGGCTNSRQQVGCSDNQQAFGSGDGGPVMITTSTVQPSVSDFLEPMNKLGPLVYSPTIPSSCTENGRQYSIGEQIPTLESCKHCYCGPEGLKECKMIECSLRVAHNCRAVIPDGHCCPIRYDCPNSNSIGQTTRTMQRYRSEVSPDAGLEQQPAWQSPPFSHKSVPTAETVEQANQQQGEQVTTEVPIVFSTRELVEKKATNFESLEESAGQQQVSPTGASFDEQPQLQQQQQQHQQAAEPVAMNLTEELNKFIMQINQNNSLHGTDYSLVSHRQNDTATNEQQPQPHSLTTDYHSVQAPGEQNQSQASSSPLPPPPLIPSGMYGIPSIEPEPINSSNNQQEFVPEQQAAPAQALDSAGATGVAGQQRDSRAALGELSAGGGSVGNGDRVSDNGGSHGQTYANLSEPQLAGVTPASVDDWSPSSTTSEPSDDYIDSVDESSNCSRANRTSSTDTSAISRTRSLRSHHSQYTTSANQREPLLVTLAKSNQTSSAPTIVFDDELASIQANYNNGNSTEEFYLGDRPKVAAVITGVAHTEPTIGTTKCDEANRAASEPQQPSSADSVVDNNSGKLEQPPQTSTVATTTGMPIGMEDAQRAPGSSGWLRSLSGALQSFGRRLQGSQAQPQLEPEGSEQQRQRAPVDNQTTGRSKSQVYSSQLLNQWLKNILSGTTGSDTAASGTPVESSWSSGGREAPDESGGGFGGLVMRPLARRLIGEPSARLLADGERADAASDSAESAANRPLPPYEPATMIGSASEQMVEIVTAAEPNEPDVFTQAAERAASRTSGSNLAEFARRSDVLDDESLRDHTDETPGQVLRQNLDGAQLQLRQATTNDRPSSNPQNLMMIQRASSKPSHQYQPQNKQLVLLACFDQATNRTYQPNEIIPKDDPCKTCTCILGAELCQTLVCPAKPDESCREERRPGECCANWLCNGAGQSTSSGTPVQQQQQVSSQTPPLPMLAETQAPRLRVSAPTELSRSSGRPGGANVISNNNNPLRSMIPTQRAMHVDSDIRSAGSGSNGLEPRYTPQQSVAQQSMIPANGNLMMGSNNNNNQNRMFSAMQQPQSRATSGARPLMSQPSPSQSLPNHPIRTSELGNYLPPHLRFRPHNDGLQGALHPFASHLLNLDPNKVMFSGAPSQRFANEQPVTQASGTGANFGQRQQQPPSRSSNQPQANQIWRTDQLVANGRNSLIAPFNQHSPNNLFVRPQVLAHPQRQPMQPPAYYSNNQKPLNNAHGSQNGDGANQWKQVTKPSGQAANPNDGSHHQLPHNVLIPRMSSDSSAQGFKPIPAATNDALQPQQPGLISRPVWPAIGAPAAQPPASQLIPMQHAQHQGFGPSGNQPLVVPMQSTTTTSTPQPSQPPADNSASTLSSNEQMNASSMPPTRVLFEATRDQHPAGFNIQLAPVLSTSDDPGFRPIVQPGMLQHRESPTIVTSTTEQSASEPSANERDTAATIAAEINSIKLDDEQEPSSSIAPVSSTTALAAQSFDNQLPGTSIADVAPLSNVNFASSDPSTTTTTTNSPNSRGIEPKPELGLTQVSNQNPQEHRPIEIEVKHSSGERITTTTSEDQTTTTSFTSYSDETSGARATSTSPSGSESTVSSMTSDSTTEAAAQSYDLDPLAAMFKVSECNIYGRLYKVGQSIEELSDVCKRCTCTSNGVDCQRQC